MDTLKYLISKVMSDSVEKLFEQLKRNISMAMFQGDTSLAQWRPTDVIPAPSSGEMIPGRFYMFISDIKYSDSRLVRIAPPPAPRKNH